MDPTLLFDLITKGLQLLPTLITAGSQVVQTIEDLKTLSQAGSDGEVDDQVMTDIEARFDANVAKFNAPLPPKA
jgi:hypothetical protein